MFYACEEGGCFTKALSYSLTATNAQSRIGKRRMLQQPNCYSRGRRKAEKRKSDGVSQQSGWSLDEAIPGGVETSPDTHFVESKIKNQSTVVRAHNLQEQSIIICPNADTIVSVCEECSLLDPEQNESSIQGS
ncbi:MAG: hypothetical protein GY861_05230 [bacterium]|nr:hypothetical protein [bacterium]